MCGDAIEIAGIILQNHDRTGSSLLGTDVGAKVRKIHIAAAVNPIFSHGVPPFLLLNMFDGEVSGHVQIPLTVELRQHRTIWQERSAKDFASYESYKRAGILYVFPPFYNCTDGAKDWAKAADTIVR